VKHLKQINVDPRVTVLGHIQRGGNPSGMDRVLASRFGAEAVKAIINGESGICIGIKNNKLIKHNIVDIFEIEREIPNDLYYLANRYLNTYSINKDKKE